MLDGLRVVTASPFRRPLSMCGLTVLNVEKHRSISPARSAIVVGPPPLYGICSSFAPANCESISIAMWLVVPLPLCPPFRPPFWRLDSSISSFTVFAGTLGCSVSTSGTDDVQITGARSFTGSNLNLPAKSVVFTDSADEVKSSV